MKTITHVIVKCDRHGCFEILPRELRLWVCDNSIELSYYEFTCEDCGIIRRPASLSALYLLWHAGIKSNHWTLPLEALEPHAPEALTEDDLIKFGRSLATWDEVTV